MPTPRALEGVGFHGLCALSYAVKYSERQTKEYSLRSQVTCAGVSILIVALWQCGGPGLWIGL